MTLGQNLRLISVGDSQQLSPITHHRKQEMLAAGQRRGPRRSERLAAKRKSEEGEAPEPEPNKKAKSATERQRRAKELKMRAKRKSEEGEAPEPNKKAKSATERQQRAKELKTRLYHLQIWNREWGLYTSLCRPFKPETSVKDLINDMAKTSVPKDMIKPAIILKMGVMPNNELGRNYDWKLQLPRGWSEEKGKVLYKTVASSLPCYGNQSDIWNENLTLSSIDEALKATPSLQGIPDAMEKLQMVVCPLHETVFHQTNPWLQNLVIEANRVVAGEKGYSAMHAALQQPNHDFWSVGYWATASPEDMHLTGLGRAATLVGAQASMQDYMTSHEIPRSFPLPADFFYDLRGFWGLTESEACTAEHMITRWMTGKKSVQVAKGTCMNHVMRHKKLVQASVHLLRSRNMTRELILKIMKP